MLAICAKTYGAAFECYMGQLARLTQGQMLLQPMTSLPFTAKVNGDKSQWSRVVSKAPSPSQNQFIFFVPNIETRLPPPIDEPKAQ